MSVDVTSPLANLTLSDLNLTRNCEATGAALVQWLDSGNRSVPYDVLVEMVRKNLDGDLAMTDGDIINWYSSMNDTIGGMKEPLIEDCFLEYCRAVKWDGNSDLAGIGVLTAYSIQVSITSFFIITSLFYSLVLKHPPRRMSIATISDRPFFSALQSSIGIFWDTALLFAFSVSIASIILTFTDRATYTQAFCALSTVLVTPPLIALWPFYVPSCSRPLPRRIALFTLCCVTFAMGTRHAVGTYFPDSQFEKYCYNFEEETAARTAKWCVLSATAYLGLGVIVWVAYHWTMFRDWRVLRRATAWKHRHRHLGGVVVDALFVIAVGLIPFAFMWVTLVNFVILREEIAARAGDSIQEGKWGFGQILALVTWIPTALDFVVVWWNASEGLAWRLPAGLAIRDKPSSLDGEGMEMATGFRSRILNAPRARTWTGYERVSVGNMAESSDETQKGSGQSSSL